jgi:hypothetical protein
MSNATHQRKEISKQLTIIIHLFILTADSSLLEPLKSSELHRIKPQAAIFNFVPLPVCLLRMSFYRNFVQQTIFTSLVHVKGAIGL